MESAPGALVLNRADLTVISPPSSHRHIVKWLMGQRHDETCPRLEPGTSTGKGTSNCMSETKIDFIPQSYPFWVPVAPRKLPWLPPHEGEGIWRARLAKLTDEAMDDEITGQVSVYPLLGGA